MPPTTAKPTVTWNPGDYAAHSASQQAWARELIGRLQLRGDEHILDVGCGDGKVTAELARAVPRGQVTGIDASGAMIDYARRNFPPTTCPNVRFAEMDARKIRFTEPFDLLFSNAALHWVDDHPAFLQGAAKVLRPGGRLLVSCGGKGNAQDVFLALRTVIRRQGWRHYFRKIPTPYFFHRPEEYEQWLPQHGLKAVAVRLLPKLALHPGREGFAGWFRTTWLPYTQRVPEARREEFIAAVVERYLTVQPPDATGQVGVRMVRLEIEAVKI
ncbi:MAG TPA: methyltransferase domain-containing protein [Dongiaceae bacterium]|nr:methyltransferase domain-containing protein [Dongiaceae bacterium]